MTDDPDLLTVAGNATTALMTSGDAGVATTLLLLNGRGDELGGATFLEVRDKIADALGFHLAALKRELGRMRVLAERAYPGLKPSGICAHHGFGEPTPPPATCGCCYPDLRALIDGHSSVYDELYRQVLALAGVEDPPGGRFGATPAMEVLRSKVADLERELAEKDRLILAQAERIKAQSELLSKRAELS